MNFKVDEDEELSGYEVMQDEYIPNKDNLDKEKEEVKKEDASNDEEKEKKDDT